jgi:hypothetical protein
MKVFVWMSNSWGLAARGYLPVRIVLHRTGSAYTRYQGLVPVYQGWSSEDWQVRVFGWCVGIGFARNRLGVPDISGYSTLYQESR